MLSIFPRIASRSCSAQRKQGSKPLRKRRGDKAHNMYGSAGGKAHNLLRSKRIFIGLMTSDRKVQRGLEMKRPERARNEGSTGPSQPSSHH